MSVPFALDANLDTKELLKLLMHSAEVVKACILELRRRQFNIDEGTGENYWLACRLVQELRPCVKQATVRSYVNNLRKYLDMKEHELPPTFSITSIRRSSERQRDTPQSGSPAAPAEPKVLNPIFCVIADLRFLKTANWCSSDDTAAAVKVRTHFHFLCHFLTLF
jgi:hypothetical protein